MKRQLTSTESAALRSLVTETYVATGRSIAESGNADAFVTAAAADRSGRTPAIATENVLDDLARLSQLVDELSARRDELLREAKNIHGRDLLARAVGRSVTWVRARLSEDRELSDLREERLVRDGSRWRLRRDDRAGQ